MNDGHSAAREVALLDQVLVEADIEGRQTSFRAVTVRVCPTELWLSLSSPDERLEKVRADQTLVLTLSRSEAALVSRSRFLRPLDGGRLRDFAVAWPGVLDRVQRRAHVRYRFDWPVCFRHLDEAPGDARGDAACGTTVNISAGGLLLESESALSVNDRLELTLPLFAGEGVKLLGVVVRVQAADGVEPNPAGTPDRTQAGVKFTHMTAAERERLERFILLTEHRRGEAGTRT